MNDPRTFMNTIYLGDRACKALILDGWNRQVRIVVNTISRIRDFAPAYDTTEDIENGHIVFESVSSYILEPSGILPNDWIYITNVETVRNSYEETSEKKQFLFTIDLGAIDKIGEAQNITLTIIAEGVYLEDPNHPGVPIRD